VAPEVIGGSPRTMERFDLTLPDFTRLSWVSDQAREVWEPRLRRVTKAWLDIEWLSILSGVRACGVTMVTPEEFIDKAGRWALRGLNAIPVEIQGNAANYGSTGRRPVLGEPFVFRVVVGIPRDVAEFKAAWDAGDDQAIGDKLGYPPCCYEFFQRVWVKEGYLDTTWPMAVATGGGDVPDDRAIRVTGPAEANILWRWMGARPVPHLPCSLVCAPTVELGRQLIQVGREAGYGEEMGWLLEILSWPVEWSALHGIAEIKTPILKVSTRTDATKVKYIVRRPGTAYPAEGAQGLGFPYQMPHATPLVTLSAGFGRGLRNPIPAVVARPGWYATDNGFSSRAAMDRAHQPIAELAAAVLSGNAGNVLDLGCGNGALLRRIVDTNPGVVPFGIDIDGSRIAHAREVLPEFGANFVIGDLLDSDALWLDGRRYALVIVMPGRLVGAGPQRAAALRRKLETKCDHLLVYAYGDWLTRHQDLRGLARKVGLSLLSSGANVTASVAMYRADGSVPETEADRTQSEDLR